MSVVGAKSQQAGVNINNQKISQVVSNATSICNKYLTTVVNDYFNDVSNTTSLCQYYGTKKINSSVNANSFFSYINSSNTNKLVSLLTLLQDYNIIQHVTTAIENTNNFKFDQQLSDDIKSLSSNSQTLNTNNEKISDLTSSIFF
jgi:hypothetical protein